MSSSSTRGEFLRSEYAVELRRELEKMVDDPKYNTKLRYSVNAPDGADFIEKHMNYMSCHLQMDPMQYIANLKLMMKVGNGKR